MSWSTTYLIVKKAQVILWPFVLFNLGCLFGVGCYTVEFDIGFWGYKDEWEIEGCEAVGFCKGKIGLWEAVRYLCEIRIIQSSKCLQNSIYHLQ